MMRTRKTEKSNESHCCLMDLAQFSSALAKCCSGSRIEKREFLVDVIMDGKSELEKQELRVFMEHALTLILPSDVLQQKVLVSNLASQCADDAFDDAAVCETITTAQLNNWVSRDQGTETIFSDLMTEHFLHPSSGEIVVGPVGGRGASSPRIYLSRPSCLLREEHLWELCWNLPRAFTQVSPRPKTARRGGAQIEPLPRHPSAFTLHKMRLAGVVGAWVGGWGGAAGALAAAVQQRQARQGLLALRHPHPLQGTHRHRGEPGRGRRRGRVRSGSGPSDSETRRRRRGGTPMRSQQPRPETAAASARQRLRALARRVPRPALPAIPAGIERLARFFLFVLNRDGFTPPPPLPNTTAVPKKCAGAVGVDSRHGRQRLRRLRPGVVAPLQPVLRRGGRLPLLPAAPLQDLQVPGPRPHPPAVRSQILTR